LPSWSRDLAAGVKAINAKAETVADKPTFRAAFKARRCLIPASGYYEWKHVGKAKQPHFIHPRDSGLLAFAGPWDAWAKGAAPVESCSIITTTASEATRCLHERAPVILDPSHFAAWLDPLTPASALYELLPPCAPERIALHPVAPLVGNVRNDAPELEAQAAALFTARSRFSAASQRKTPPARSRRRRTFDDPLAAMHFADDSIVIVADDDAPVIVPAHDDGSHVPVLHFHDRAMAAHMAELARHCRGGAEAKGDDRGQAEKDASHGCLLVLQGGVALPTLGTPRRQKLAAEMLIFHSWGKAAGDQGFCPRGLSPA
jgi:putative SOS response-associated peptidase YedK